MTTNKKMRALELLEEENTALKAQLFAVQKAIAQMAVFQHEDVKAMLPTMKGYSNGDEEAPFMSEACLYLILGKEAARSVLRRFEDIMQVANVNLKDAQALVALERAQAEFEAGGYELDFIREKLPPAPEAPVLEAKEPAACYIKRKLRTPKQQEEVEAWYESKPYRAYMEELSKHRQHPMVSVCSTLNGLTLLRDAVRDAQRQVREAGFRAYIAMRMEKDE